MAAGSGKRGALLVRRGWKTARVPAAMALSIVGLGAFVPLVAFLAPSPRAEFRAVAPALGVFIGAQAFLMYPLARRLAVYEGGFRAQGLPHSWAIRRPGLFVAWEDVEGFTVGRARGFLRYVEVKLGPNARCRWYLDGSQDEIDPEVARVLLERAALAGRLREDTTLERDGYLDVVNIEEERKMGRFASGVVTTMGLVFVVGAASGVADIFVNSHFHLIHLMYIPFFVGASAVMLRLRVQFEGMRRTEGLAVVEGEAMFVPRYDPYDRAKCAVPRGDVLYVHHGGKGLDAAGIGELERIRGAAFTVRERRLLSIPQWFRIVVVTREKVHPVDVRLVPDVDALRKFVNSQSFSTAARELAA